MVAKLWGVESFSLHDINEKRNDKEHRLSFWTTEEQLYHKVLNTKVGQTENTRCACFGSSSLFFTFVSSFLFLSSFFFVHPRPGPESHSRRHPLRAVGRRAGSPWWQATIGWRVGRRGGRAPAPPVAPAIPRPPRRGRRSRRSGPMR